MSDIVSIFLEDPDPEERPLPGEPVRRELTREEAERLIGPEGLSGHFHRSDEPPMPFLVGCGCASDPIRLRRPPLADR